MTIIRITFMQLSHIFSFPHSMYPFIIFTRPLTLADGKRQRSWILLMNSWSALSSISRCLSPESPCVLLLCLLCHPNPPFSQHQCLFTQSCNLLYPTILEWWNKAAEAWKPEEWRLPSYMGRETNWPHNHWWVKEGVDCICFPDIWESTCREVGWEAI